MDTFNIHFNHPHVFPKESLQRSLNNITPILKSTNLHPWILLSSLACLICSRNFHQFYFWSYFLLYWDESFMKNSLSSVLRFQHCQQASKQFLQLHDLLRFVIKFSQRRKAFPWLIRLPLRDKGQLQFMFDAASGEK